MDLVFTHCFGHLGDAPIVEGVLHGFGHRFWFHVGGDVADLAVLSQSVSVGVGAMHHRLECEFGVEIADTFQVGVGDDWDGMVADHTIRFIGGEFPYREEAALLVLSEEGMNKGGGFVWLQEGVQGFTGAVGIP